VISNRSQVIAYRSQVIAYRSQVSSNDMVDIIIIYLNTEKQYRYKRSVQLSENSTYIGSQYEYRKTVLQNNINVGFKLFIIIKKRIIVELSSTQVGMQASVYPSEASKLERT